MRVERKNRGRPGNGNTSESVNKKRLCLTAGGGFDRESKRRNYKTRKNCVRW